MEITPRLKAFLDAEEIDPSHVEQLEPNGPVRNIITPSFKGWLACSSIDEPGEYVLVVGNWRTGEKKHFFSSTTKRKEKYTGIVKEQEERIDEEKRKAEEKTREETQKLLAQCNEFDTSHPYFTRKHLVAHEGARTRTNSFGKVDIVVPLKDFEGVVWGVQFIQDSGDKQFISGLRLKGSFFQFGKFTPQSDVVYLCEGWATGSSIRLATQEAVLCAMTAGNLRSVAEEFRKLFPKVPLIICADKDASGVGETYAKQACAVGHATYILPKTSGTDFNDLHIESGIDEVTRQIKAHAPIEPSLIASSEYNGFHIQNKKGGLSPDVEGLYKYYKRKVPHFTNAESQVTYEWDGKKYVQAPNLMLENFAQRHFNPAVHSSAVSEFVKLIKRSSSRNAEDVIPSGVHNFQNGVLENNVLRPHSPKDYFLHVLPFEYDPDAKCEVFERTLNKVLPDRELQRQFMEFMGYALSGDPCWIHKALVLKGEGSNGKSTLIEIMRHVIGEANCTSLTQNHLSVEHHLDCLNGKLANFAEETPTKVGDTTNFKALISGGSVQARALYKPPYSLVSRAKFIFACNEMPVTQDTTEGFFRRLSIIPFDVTFSPKDPDYDPFIVAKMKKESAGIFNLCTKAYEQLKSRGRWLDGERTISVLQEYKNEADIIRVWVSEHIADAEEPSCVSLSSAYDEFCLDAEKQGFRYIPTRPQFTKKLKAIYKSDTRFGIKKLDGKSTRVLTCAKFME